MFPLTARSVQSRALLQKLARTDLFLSVTAPCIIKYNVNTNCKHDFTPFNISNIRVYEML